MKLIAATVLLAVFFGYVRGGTLERLGNTRIRWPYLVAVGLVLQLVPVGGAVAAQLSLLLSFIALTIAAVANLGRPGFGLILAGVVANFLVIATNHGMPVSLNALAVSGQTDTLPQLVSGAVRHHLLGPADRLTLLADIIAIPPPVGTILSVGDVLVYAGVATVIARGMSWPPAVTVPAVAGAAD